VKFENRGVPVVAISVDPPEVSRDWAEKKGFSFTLAADPEMQVIDAYHLRNPDTPGLALHAVYIVQPDGSISYRKVARRRARSREILYALDGKPVSCCPGSCGKTICDWDVADAKHDR
jgi:peroxiredoxin